VEWAETVASSKSVSPRPRYKEAQFIISTHSPVILGYPDAQILSFDDGTIHEVEYENTTSLQVVRQFVNERQRFLDELLKED
jgi:predicted ATPase